MISLRWLHCRNNIFFCRGMNVTAITTALIGGTKHARACQAVAAMMSKGNINPADVTIVRQIYTPKHSPVIIIHTRCWQSSSYQLLFSLVCLMWRLFCCSKAPGLHACTYLFTSCGLAWSTTSGPVSTVSLHLIAGAFVVLGARIRMWGAHTGPWLGLEPIFLPWWAQHPNTEPSR